MPEAVLRVWTCPLTESICSDGIRKLDSVTSVSLSATRTSRPKSTQDRLIIRALLECRQTHVHRMDALEANRLLTCFRTSDRTSTLPYTARWQSFFFCCCFCYCCYSYAAATTATATTATTTTTTTAAAAATTTTTYYYYYYYDGDGVCAAAAAAANASTTVTISLKTTCHVDDGHDDDNTDELLRLVLRLPRRRQRRRLLLKALP